MALEDNLYRTENVLTALDSGNLHPGSWACDHVLAHGLAGQTNPLGNALIHLLAYPNADNLRLTVVFLAGVLERTRVCKPRDSADVARDALRWWADKRCPTCEGRGLIAQAVPVINCQACSASGEKPRPVGEVRDAVTVIDQATIAMERKLREKLRNDTAETRPEAEYVVGHPVRPHDRTDLIPSRGGATPKAQGRA